MTQTAQTVQPTNQAKLAILEAALDKVANIATLPEITVKIITLVENPKSTAADLHKLINHDPALCTRVLKVVNSAFYGLPGQIGSINRAIVLLGLNAVKNIAIATSLSKLFQGGAVCGNFSAQEIWKHSVGVAATVKLLAQHIKLNLPDEAFLAGMIHDIGLMVELQSDRAKLVEAIELAESQGMSLLDAEKQVLGATHQDFGAALCRRWKFPESFSYVAGFHHNPLEIDANRRTLTALVHVADKLTARCGIGYTGTVADTEIDPRILDYLKLDEDAVNTVCEKIPEAIEVAEQLMN